MKKAFKPKYAKKIRQNLKKEKVQIDPLLDALLEELERLEKIRFSLYEVFHDADDVMEKYTNKAGAKNTVVNAAVKEYKSYTQRFNEVCKTLDAMLKARLPEKLPEEEDPLDKLNRRDSL